EVDDVRQPRVSDTDGASRSPGGFEGHHCLGFRLVDACDIVKINPGSGARPADSVAAIVGARHARAGPIEIDHRHAIVPLGPGLVSPPDALRLDAGDAAQAEARRLGMIVEIAVERAAQRKALPYTLRIGLAEIGPGTR